MISAGNRVFFLFSVLFFTCGILFGVGVNGTRAADTIHLTYSGVWPSSHPISVATSQWIEKIEKETQGRVKIKPFWAGALYKPKDSTIELANGVADIGDISGAYAPMGFEFEKSMRMVFWGVNDRQLSRKIYINLLSKFPELTKEFTRAGVKVMAYASIPPYQLLLADKPVKKIGDLKGMTFKATGELTDVATSLGGEGIVMPMSESYTALQKSTIDGAFAPYETMKSFRFGEVVKYALELNIGSAPAAHWGFCLKSWNKLPTDIQKVFEDNVDWFGRKIEELVFAGEKSGIDFAKKHRVEFLKLPENDLEKIYATVDKIIVEKMSDLDGKGLPGTPVYKEIRSQIEKSDGK